MIKSPCINICKMNPQTKLCEGCKRTIEEIASWSMLTDEEKAIIIQELRLR